MAEQTFTFTLSELNQILVNLGTVFSDNGIQYLTHFHSEEHHDQVVDDTLLDIGSAIDIIGAKIHKANLLNTQTKHILFNAINEIQNQGKHSELSKDKMLNQNELRELVNGNGTDLERIQRIRAEIQETKTIRDMINLFIKYVDKPFQDRSILLNEYALCIQRNSDKLFSECLDIAKQNIGYMLGYYDNELRQKVYNAYEISHPIYGNI